MIIDDLQAALITAMKARDSLTADTIKGIKAACTNELVAKGMKPTDAVSDELAITVIRREVKKRKEAAEAFRTGGRAESADKEDAERAILEAYLPALMSRDEIMKIAVAKKAELGLTDKAESGKFMGMLMKDLAGKADGNDVKEIINSLF